MGLFNLFKNKSTEEAKPVAKDSGLDAVIAEIKRLTATPAVKLCFSKKDNVSILSSKLGGIPYRDEASPYSADENGASMPLLLQLNLSEIEMETPLPKTGMLQFYIANDMSLQCQTVYHKNIHSRAADEIKNLGVPVMPNDGFSPVQSECAVQFEAVTDYIGVSDIGFDAVLRQAVKNMTGKEITGGIYDNFSDAECEKICRELPGTGHKLFGYPAFTQCDPREEESDEILLLQLDSEYTSDNCIMKWGDSGIGNFFIKKEALQALDFSNILYYWDCY